MKSSAALCAAALSVALAHQALAQGDLQAPPGPPAPTHKTLQQIEPRTDVATLAGDASNQHIITSAGSYYLSRGNRVINFRHNNSLPPPLVRNFNALPAAACYRFGN